MDCNPRIVNSCKRLVVLYIDIRYNQLMIKDFKTKETEAIYKGVCNKKTMKVLPKELHGVAVEKLDMIDVASYVEDLQVPPSNKLEKKKGKLKEYYAIRINEQYRIAFKWIDGHAESVWITDYH